MATGVPRTGQRSLSGCAQYCRAWVVDGWLELAPTSASSPLLSDVTDLVRLLDVLGDAAADPIPGGPRLRLTAKAYREVPWLGDPGDGEAAQQAAAPDGP